MVTSPIRLPKSTKDMGSWINNQYGLTEYAIHSCWIKISHIFNLENSLFLQEESPLGALIWFSFLYLLLSSSDRSLSAMFQIKLANIITTDGYRALKRVPRISTACLGNPLHVWSKKQSTRMWSTMYFSAIKLLSILLRWYDHNLYHSRTIIQVWFLHRQQRHQQLWQMSCQEWSLSWHQHVPQPQASKDSKYYLKCHAKFLHSWRGLYIYSVSFA